MTTPQTNLPLNRLGAITFALSAVFPALAIAAPDPAVTRTEQMIAAFKKVKSDASTAANASAFSEIDSLISYETITARALEPRATKFTAAQKADFQKKLQELIGLVAYPESGDFFRRAKLTFKPLKTEGAETHVPFTAKLPEEDLEVEVTLHWAKQADGILRMVDVSFDGDSLVRDYQNQFSKIIDKDGVKGLFQKLEERRASVDRAPPAGKAPATGQRMRSP